MNDETFHRVPVRLFLVCLVALVAACGDDDDGTAAVPDRGPELIVFENPGIRPEGVEYDAVRERFLVGSTTQGTIFSVSDSGEVSVVVSDPGLTSTLGLHIDGERDTLVVAGAFSASGPIGVGYYDLQTGATIRVVDLGDLTDPGSLANDVVVDAAGNAYVTETIRSAVYKIDADGVASLLLQDPALTLANGIEIYDDAYLLVATIGPGPMVRIPIDDPDSFDLVETDVDVSGDGIVFTPDGDLTVVTIGGVASVIRLRSDDGWATAKLVATWDGTAISDSGPTTAAVRGDDVHVIFARLNEPDAREYQIARTDFDVAD